MEYSRKHIGLILGVAGSSFSFSLTAVRAGQALQPHWTLCPHPQYKEGALYVFLSLGGL
jgi:hypothetical protein